MEQQVGTAVGTIQGLLIVGVIGLVIGAVAKLIVPGKDPGGILVTMLLGLAGSWIGGFAGSAFGVTTLAGGIIMAVLGSILLLLLWRLIQRGRTA